MSPYERDGAHDQATTRTSMTLAKAFTTSLAVGAAVAVVLSTPMAPNATASSRTSSLASQPASQVMRQPVPQHTGLVPNTPRTNTPRISGGEIWDIEVVGNRVFIAGSFTSIANKTGITTAVP